MIWNLYQVFMDDLAFSSGMLILICRNCLKSTTHRHWYIMNIHVSIPYLLTVNVWVNPLGFLGYQHFVVWLLLLIFLKSIIIALLSPLIIKKKPISVALLSPLIIKKKSIIVTLLSPLLISVEVMKSRSWERPRK